MKIGFIGTGIMGAPIALHLARANYDVTVFNRTISKAEKLKPEVSVSYTIKELAESSDIIFSIVGYPKDVDEVIHEVFKYAKKGTIIVDMTTSSPSLAENLYEKGKELGFRLVDAPVTGGDQGAKSGTLSIMVGSEKEVFDEIVPLLQTFGKTITYMGKAGSGQYTKLANQIAISGALAGVAESLYFAMEKNLPLDAVHQVLSGGSASSNQLIYNGKKMILKDYEPGFFIKHFVKDLNLALDEAKGSLPIATKVRDMLQQLIEKGFENKGTQAFILNYLDSHVS
ncbi:NAD(P)-dependent oxidoreductase [Acholeplasma equirhinis]|uniref:NAD(P)-dependent oxidoreductase n=1 Tax=Acholeplasma equirhinis TaxID=555393 RepID=UPI00197A9FF9|nr:NAD(P)-dependent oxidoreductase [Acholeplasma equirhinis]MBN3490961.1 NAD(P)-dependent oxidoreductase [Acholeplasma equirhinis]